MTGDEKKIDQLIAKMFESGIGRFFETSYTPVEGTDFKGVTFRLVPERLDAEIIAGMRANGLMT